MSKTKIFLSHSTQEQEIARAFKKIIEDNFLKMVSVFIASDHDSISSGSKWLDNITSSLKDCSIQIILCSPESITKPWVNFESGSGWVREIPVIPLCYAGLDKNNLKPPLSLLQSANAENEEDLGNIIKTIADTLGSTPPSIDFSHFIESINNFSQEAPKREEASTEKPNITPAKQTKKNKECVYDSDIDRHLKILRLIDASIQSNECSSCSNISYDNFINGIATESKEDVIDSIYQLIKNNCIKISEVRTLRGMAQIIIITTDGKDVLNRNPQ